MTTLHVETSEGVELRVDVAGPGSRWAAAFLDFVIVFFLLLAMLFVLAVARAFDPTRTTQFLIGLYLGGVVLLVLGYFAAFHAFGNGQTPGKRVFGIRVVSIDGQPMRPMQNLLRSLLLPIDLLPFPASIGWIVAMMTTKHQRIGDIVAGTMAIRLRSSGEASEPWPNDTWTALVPHTLPLTVGTAARISADDRALLREIITRRDLTDESKRHIFVAAARYYAERLELGPFEDARVLLKELYLFAREHSAHGQSADSH